MKTSAQIKKLAKTLDCKVRTLMERNDEIVIFLESATSTKEDVIKELQKLENVNISFSGDADDHFYISLKFIDKE